MKVTLHKDANQHTLIFARIFLFSIWFIKIVSLRFSSLASLPNELHYKFGIMKLIPERLFSFALSESGLITIQLLTLAGITLVILGVDRKKIALAITLLLLTVYFGIAKGFGGHVNHRELILLYTSYILLFLPCYSSCFPKTEAILQRKDDSKLSQKDSKQWQSCMVLLLLVLIFSYFLIAVARLFVGFPHVFQPEIMFDWIVSRNIRPNPYQMTYGLTVIETPLLRTLTQFLLPFSTVIELLFPMVLFCKPILRNFFIILMISFHIGIFFIMNISFIENIALLLLLCNYTVWVDYFVKRCKSE